MRHVADRREQAALLALVAARAAPWHEIAALVETAGSAERIVRGDFSGFDPEDVELAERLRGMVTEAHLKHARERLDTMLAAHPDVSLITVLEADYPANLRSIFNRPPFLWLKGQLAKIDERAIAIVGTRDASDEGLLEARSLARALAARGVTIISGLARGIDTAAHEGALEMNGRTVAVMGTGIHRVYPPENELLAARIVKSGALVSQFWPEAAPVRSNFPLRNVVTSGMAIGTVVIEASATSGAKGQARLALEHGKTLFLVESLVMQQEWAQRYAKRPGAVVVKRADDVMQILAAAAKPVQQLRFA